MSRDIPLFPLGLVLFPNQLLPLHIFEDRYKRMIGECLEEDTEFGVVLIKQGREVGGGAVPFTVGTTAKIVNVERLPEGRMNLQVMGQEPFRVVNVTQQDPYMRGEIEPLERDVGETEGLDSVIASVKEQFSAHLGILARLSERERVNLDLDQDAESLSYLVASVLAIQMPEKQELLELTQAGKRLRREATLLNRENRALQAFLYLRKTAKKVQPVGGNLQDRISPN
jgi:Lon protease-like protein